jgi:uroporphyrinogen III methyltransferase/synthase
LISFRGWRALVAADAVLADRLLPRDFLEQLGIPTAAKTLEWLGDDGPRWPQDAINRWLVLHAQSGQTVARLKGGDSFVFGRGDDEVRSLAEHGIPWEVIPGPSSCTAVPAAAGLPLTRHARDHSFAVATARVTGGTIQGSFPRADTLVVLMGISVLPLVAARLLADGWAPDTPVAVIERGTLPWERRVWGTLSQIAQLARQAGVSSPGLVIVGGAARGKDEGRRMRDEPGNTTPGVSSVIPHPSSFSPPRVLFTGSDPENFRTLGEILHWPALQFVPDQEGRRLLPNCLARLRAGAFDWLVLSGKLAATSLFTAMADQGLDARILAGTKIAAIGQTTARRLGELFLQPDAVIDLPGETAGTGEGTTTWFERLAGQTVAAIHGTHIPGELGRRIDETAAAVTHVTLHSVAPHPDLGRPLPEHDAIYFVSPAGVDAFWQAYGPAAFRQEVWCLGEATRDAIARHGAAAKVVVPLAADRPADNLPCGLDLRLV